MELIEAAQQIRIDHKDLEDFYNVTNGVLRER